MDALWSRGSRLLRVPIALQPRCSQTTRCPKDHGRGRGSAWASSTDAEDLESSLSQGPGCLLLGTEMQTLIQGPCLPPSLLLIKCCRTPVRCSPTPQLRAHPTEHQPGLMGIQPPPSLSITGRLRSAWQGAPCVPLSGSKGGPTGDLHLWT